MQPERFAALTLHEMVTILNFIGILLLVFANGFFVAAEFALVGVRRSRIEALASGGGTRRDAQRATRLLGLLDNLNAYLSAAQLGITLASLALGSVGEPVFAHLLEEPLAGRVPDAVRHLIAYIFALTIITILHIVLGEQAPKLLGLERAERVALATALPMQIFYKTFKLPIEILDWASARVIRLFGLNSAGEHGSVYTVEELRQLVDLSHKSGHIETNNQQLINRVFDFSEAEVREAMIPRTTIVALPVTTTIDEAKRAFYDSGFSRLPVYRDQLDNVVGVLFIKELMPYLSGDFDGEFDVEKMLHAPVFLPATAKLGQALARMQGAQTHLAFVVDEHGGIEGIVTLEDLLEEIVGEINDEYDEEVHAQIVPELDGSYLIDGSLAIRDANRRFDLHLPEDSDYTTLAGFLLAQAGHMLQPGEQVEYDNARFTVETVEGRRIRRVRFMPLVAESATLEPETTRIASD